MVCGKRWNIPIPNAGWSGVASTATASGVSQNCSVPACLPDSVPAGVSTEISLAAAWLYAHFAHPSLVESGSVGERRRGERLVGGGGLLRTTRVDPPGGVIPAVTAPLSWVKTPNE